MARRETDDASRYLKHRPDKPSRPIIFAGHKLDMEAVWKVRDEFFPPLRETSRKRYGAAQE